MHVDPLQEMRITPKPGRDQRGRGLYRSVIENTIDCERRGAAMTTTVAGGLPGKTGTTTTKAPVELHRPPTVFAREAPEELVRRGYDVARRAIGYRMENVPFDDAVSKLLRIYPQEDVLRIANSYLAFTDFEVPGTTQVDALFLVEDALYRLEKQKAREWWQRRA
jgi:hypothetical protein